jgi:hypothetical protein
MGEPGVVGLTCQEHEIAWLLVNSVDADIVLHELYWRDHRDKIVKEV